MGLVSLIKPNWKPEEFKETRPIYFSPTIDSAVRVVIWLGMSYGVYLKLYQQGKKRGWWEANWEQKYLLGRNISKEDREKKLEFTVPTHYRSNFVVQHLDRLVEGDRACTNLKLLDLTGVKGITPEALGKIFNCLSKLETLVLNACEGENGKSIDWENVDKYFKANVPVASRKSIKKLFLSCSGTNKIDRFVNLFDSMEILSFRGVADFSLETLKKFNKELKILDLSACQGIKIQDLFSNTLPCAVKIQELYLCQMQNLFSEETLTISKFHVQVIRPELKKIALDEKTANQFQNHVKELRNTGFTILVYASFPSLHP